MTGKERHECCEISGCTSNAAWVALLLMPFLAPGPAQTQLYGVDDVAIVDRGACQLEAWHGERASWILPACQLVRSPEVALGAGFVHEGAGRRQTKYAVEAKTLFRPLDTNSWGVGLVLGAGPNPSAVPGERRFGDVYAFIPASLSLLDDRPILHGNMGREWARTGRQSSSEANEEITGSG